MLAHLADMAIEIYAMDSALARATKSGNAMHREIADTFVNDATQRVRWSGMQAIVAMTAGSSREANLAQLERFCAHILTDTVSSRRQIAEALLDVP